MTEAEQEMRRWVCELDRAGKVGRCCTSTWKHSGYGCGWNAPGDNPSCPECGLAGGKHSSGRNGADGCSVIGANAQALSAGVPLGMDEYGGPMWDLRSAPASEADDPEKLPYVLELFANDIDGWAESKFRPSAKVMHAWALAMREAALGLRSAT